MTARIYTAHPVEDFTPITLTGHRNSVVNVFFAVSMEYVYTISKDGALFTWKNLSSDGISTLKWSLEKKFYFEKHAQVTSSAFHPTLQLLVVGFSSGLFGIYELPVPNGIHFLSISQRRVSSVAINASGDWLAFGCSRIGQLLVWEWKSETFILKQQGHFYDMNVLDFSSNGQYIVTGGDDSKVKVWNTRSGFCFVTFKEHSAAVTGVRFSPRDKVIFSSSLDGTVRAFDLMRYRNFRTFTSPSPVQFLSLAIDVSGDIVCAGSLDTFEIFVWSVRTGHLVELLTGHEGPVTCLEFSPSVPVLYSGSWDHSVRVWDVFERKGTPEVLVHKSDVRALALRPDGGELCVSSLDGDLTIWDLSDNRQSGSLNCRRDIGTGRKQSDLVSSNNNPSGKCFTGLCYSADGRCLVAGGKSRYVCIYELSQKVLLKKFRVSKNQSLDGISEKLNSKFMTEAGPLQTIDHAEDSEEEGRYDLYLPGVAKGDLSSRRTRPEIQVKSVRFSPTGCSWAACTTEGLLIYSLDERATFDPFDLDPDVTPARVLSLLQDQEYHKSLSMAFRLNEKPFIKHVVESIPLENILPTVQALHPSYVVKLLAYTSEALDSTVHLEFYLTWCFHIFNCHGRYIKDNDLNHMSILRLLQRSIIQYKESLYRLCDSNNYAMEYIKTLSSFYKEASTLETLNSNLIK
ncbi:uncharacterized protein LOC135119904 [Zophobas morio]|uniref:uncharacterized protein LOC135119904 n=1 Tax=Zophobas morio TaxID=2755281 RepID=UPI003082EE34